MVMEGWGVSRKRREPKPAEWVPTSELADKYSLTSEFFTDRIGKHFVRGVHVINCTPDAWRPTYRWHLEECHQWFAKNDILNHEVSQDSVA